MMIKDDDPLFVRRFERARCDPCGSWLRPQRHSLMKSAVSHTNRLCRRWVSRPALASVLKATSAQLLAHVTACHLTGPLVT
jgi:hypothetical protein